MVVCGLVAALVVVIAAVAVRAGVDSGEQVPLAQPSSSTTAPTVAAPADTVTFDGSMCSMEITADRIESGVALIQLVNATERGAMFDSYQLSKGYTVRAFAATLDRDRRSAEPCCFPSESEVTYLSSEVIPANRTGSAVTTMSPGRHAVVCMQPYEGEVMDLRPFKIVGPIVVR